MKKIIKLGTLVATLMLGFFAGFGGGQVAAAELNFSVTPIIPSNQIDTNKTYFELAMEPNQEQTLEVILRNDTQEAVIVEPSVNSAFTNLNGVVEYGEGDAERDDTLKHDLKDLVEVADEISIPANSSVTLELKVKMPEEAFAGILAGGITFKEKKVETTNTSDENGNGLSIENQYAYVVGLVLSESTAEVKPEVKMNKVFADQLNARNVIKANIQNITPVFINQLKVETKINKKGDTEILYQSTKEGMQFAPNSNFDFSTSLNGEKLEPGNYTLELTATSGENVWHFKDDFTIAAEEAKTLNQKDVSIEEDYLWLYILLSVIGGMLFMLILFLLFRRKKDKEEDES